MARTGCPARVLRAPRSRKFQTQMLDCGIDMGRADVKVHPVKLGQLVFQRGNDTGQAGAIRCRSD